MKNHAAAIKYLPALRTIAGVTMAFQFVAALRVEIEFDLNLLH